MGEIFRVTTEVVKRLVSPSPTSAQCDTPIPHTAAGAVALLLVLIQGKQTAHTKATADKDDAR
jgi:hypothetical protein